MSQELLSVILKSENDELPVSSLLKALSKFKDLLVELSKDIDGGPKANDWIITSLEKQSPGRVGYGIPDGLQEFNPAILQDLTIGGFEQLQKEDRTPSGWSEKALSHGRAICAIISPNTVSGIEVANGHKVVSLSSQIVANVDKILVPPYVESKGSVDGVLNVIDVTTGLVIFIDRIVDGHRVKARFPKDVKFKKFVFDNAEKRVYAQGTIRPNKQGLPKEILIQQIYLYPEAGEGKSILDMYGSDPDYTGDLASEDYIRRHRGDET